MKCPVDQTELLMSDRQGIEIDYCPKCRGVWLDRGELDKIIERSETTTPPPQAAPPRDEYRGREPHDRDRGRYRGDYDRDYDDRYHRRRRRKSFLDELFDFD